MSRSLNAPSARLLQSSRLFSIPRPLPQPAFDQATSTGDYRASDTATLPYPVQQAITTPASSHSRGDFGLKRPLPSRAIRTSTPHIKVNAHDNFAHITDFGSAANHTQTEAKWREMNVPMMAKPLPRTNYTNKEPPQSAYDDKVDHTDRDALRVDVTERQMQQSGSSGPESTEKRRWKYGGPWVTGMSEGEFEMYIVQTISARKAEFKEFLKEKMLDARVQQEQRASREQGEGRVTYYRKQELRREIEANYEKEEKKLRDNHTAQRLSSELTAAICDFLDLPGIRAPGPANLGLNLETEELRQRLTENIDKGENLSPPTTHPAAGLSHLRSRLYMENHPVHGPQAHRSPVLSRVLRARNSQIAASLNNAVLGVGGVVALDPVSTGIRVGRPRKPIDGENQLEHYTEYTRMTDALDQDIKGGNKMWVQPETAFIDEKGRVRLLVSRGDQEAVAVKTNRVQHIHEAKSASLSSPSYISHEGGYGNSRYGTRLPDMRHARPGRSHVQGFDEELGMSSQQGPIDRGAASARIRELTGGRMPNS
ncbi:Hypothetical predicted protein [Lecanosticta acicola]|uniref:Uncharacterized protein n=1 Tax=Lecanosticta acicola TaxID=111012 RepID=A0AAI9EEQ2_9PEZI|nr:Hypothetical predicted protein [Lecanosticta acicola]